MYSTAIPILPLEAVRPVQSLSAYTVQLYLYSPIGRTACTEPQCLYKDALYLLPLLMTGICWALYKQYVIASYLIMSGDQTPLGALGPTQPPKQCVPSLFP